MNVKIEIVDNTAEALTEQLAKAAAMLTGYVEHLRKNGESEYRAAQYEVTIARMLGDAESIFTIESLADDISHMGGTLEVAGAKFREYEAHHASKPTPDADKALANAQMAAMCEEAAKGAG